MKEKCSEYKSKNVVGNDSDQVHYGLLNKKISKNTA